MTHTHTHTHIKTPSAATFTHLSSPVEEDGRHLQEMGGHGNEICAALLVFNTPLQVICNDIPHRKSVLSKNNSQVKYKNSTITEQKPFGDDNSALLLFPQCDGQPKRNKYCQHRVKWTKFTLKSKQIIEKSGERRCSFNKNTEINFNFG